MDENEVQSGVYSALDIIEMISNLPTGAYVQKMKEGWAVRWRVGAHAWETRKGDSMGEVLATATRELNNEG